MARVNDWYSGELENYVNYMYWTRRQAAYNQIKWTPEIIKTFMSSLCLQWIAFHLKWMPLDISTHSVEVSIKQHRASGSTYLLSPLIGIVFELCKKQFLIRPLFQFTISIHTSCVKTKVGKVRGFGTSQTIYSFMEWHSNSPISFKIFESIDWPSNEREYGQFAHKFHQLTCSYVTCILYLFW